MSLKDAWPSPESEEEFERELRELEEEAKTATGERLKRLQERIQARKDLSRISR
jgi:hypothetical protein